MQAESVIQSFSGVLFSLSLFAKAFFQALGFLPAPCEEPLRYTIGTIDERFGIAENEVLQALQQAEALWEDASGKNLFQHTENEGLVVQFVYDERQEKTQASQDLQERLNRLQIGESEQSAEEQIIRYERAKAEYEKKQRSYEQAVKQYNEQVKRINQQGGATEEQQVELAGVAKDLQAQFKALEKSRETVNSLASAANQRIEANRTAVETYNKEVTTFQEQYGGEGEAFDQGVYTGSDITIYQYDDTARLVMVLAHEMGHALGIDHVEESEALMYYLMKDQDVTNLHLASADTTALESICQAPVFPWDR